MLKAQLPSHRDIQDLLREVDSLRKDKKLKDDTIRFLQKEKDGLRAELKHYEAVYDGQADDFTPRDVADAEIQQLKDDIIHLKDVIRRQNALLRSTGTSGSSALDRQLITRMCGNLNSLLQETSSSMGDQIAMEIQNQKEQLERTASQKRGEATWHLIEIIDRALIELKSFQLLQKRNDLPDLKANRITQHQPSGVPYGAINSENLTISRRRGTSGSARKIERSRSAPAINGVVPRPPSAAPPPSALKSIYNSGSKTNLNRLSIDQPINTASVNMLAHPPTSSRA